VGVDTLPNREIIDFISNTYGDDLIDFLIDCNMCVLNGRNCIKMITHLYHLKVAQWLTIALCSMRSWIDFLGLWPQGPLNLSQI
jgi:hypothetical protein